ncbi:hypothetical protein OSB04_017413 [Centaurea solstitialis]|uniref:Uncharacterized protein n=1 Tax=Centaurea solstitialis TaxID=347529 RepID=A0AA38TAE2_9ASTR|nr:hypothetical protein OSB04_017413 [Centaurea solstitialis]
MLNQYYIEHIELSAYEIGPLFPKWIQAHKNLTSLGISNNKISNKIPVEFWNIWPSQLVYLNLSSNNISGKVPYLSSNFGLYSRIDLSSNNFYGPIPIVTPTLLLLNLSKNRFYGGIYLVCQIVSLSFLDLSHNSLTGQLSDCLWHLKELRVLNLGHNNFFGRLPTSIGNLVRLQVLNLYNNNFTGEFHLDLKNCTVLNFLNLGVNKFFGNVPVWIGENLTRLYGLSLRSNNFFRPIPLQLCHLVNLQILDLSMNNINGTIPSCLNNLTPIIPILVETNIRYPLGYTYDNVTTIDASFEYVDNAIIGWQGNEREFTNNLGLLVSISLLSNNLTGQIPSELVDLHELLALNLSKIALFGEIPRKIGEIKKLLILDLFRNHFSGVIPSNDFLKLLRRCHTITCLGEFHLAPNSSPLNLQGTLEMRNYVDFPLLKVVSEMKYHLLYPKVKVVRKTQTNFKDEFAPVQKNSWLRPGGGTGFAIGFCIACGTSFINRHGRHTSFPFVDFMKDWVYVKVVVSIRKLERVACTSLVVGNILGRDSGWYLCLPRFDSWSEHVVIP